jgi:parvulin-like peptidyl-prolyl isomerase
MIAPLLLASALVASPVVARVGGTAITAADLADRARAVNRPAGVALLDTLVEEALMTEEGYRLGLERDPAVRAAVEAERRRRAAERLLEEDLRPAATVTDAVLSDMFHATADSITVEALAFATREEAVEALAALQQGAAVEELSPRALATPAARGKVHSHTRGSLRPQTAELLFAAPEGRFVGPVDLEPGHAVVRVLGRTVGTEAEFAARREQLRAYAGRALATELRRHLVEQLRKGAGVSVDEAFLAGTGNAVELDAPGMERVVARAAGREVRYREVAAELRRLFGGTGGGHLTGKTTKLELARSLADGILLEDEALRRGHGSARQVEAAVRSAERALVGQRFLARIRGEAAVPGEREIAAYHRDHPAEFTLPARRECGHILVASREAAEALRGRIRSDEEFAAAAREHSLDAGTRERGGCICEVTAPQLEALAARDGAAELAAALRDARPARAVGPVRSGMGWHLVRCKAWSPARVRSLDEARDDVARVLHARAAEEAVRARLAALRRAAAVVVDEAALAAAVTP